MIAIIVRARVDRPADQRRGRRPPAAAASGSARRNRASAPPAAASGPRHGAHSPPREAQDPVERIAQPRYAAAREVEFAQIRATAEPAAGARGRLHHRHRGAAIEALEIGGERPRAGAPGGKRRPMLAQPLQHHRHAGLDQASRDRRPAARCGPGTRGRRSSGPASGSAALAQRLGHGRARRDRPPASAGAAPARARSRACGGIAPFTSLGRHPIGRGRLARIDAVPEEQRAPACPAGDFFLERRELGPPEQRERHGPDRGDTMAARAASQKEAGINGRAQNARTGNRGAGRAPRRRRGYISSRSAAKCAVAGKPASSWTSPT